MPKGRPRRDRVRTNVALDADVEAKLKMFLIDPIKGGFKYGLLSQLINTLLRKWLINLAVQADPKAYLRAFGIESPTEKPPEDPSP